MVIRYLSDQKGQSTATGTGCAILHHSRVAQEGGAVARVAHVYTRHIRNTKGQRSLQGYPSTYIHQFKKSKETINRKTLFKSLLQ